MPKKPTYEQLNRKVKELEKKILEHEQFKEELKNSEERLRTLIENARDVIYTLSEEGTITSLNPAFETYTGWSPTEWIGKSLQSIVHPDDWPAELEFLESMLRGEMPSLHEVRVRTKSGGYIVVESRVTPQFKDGKFVGVLGVSRDITDRKKTEEALRIKDSAIASSINAIGITDLEDTVTYVNDSFLRLWGYDDVEEVLGRPSVEFWRDRDAAEAIAHTIHESRGWVGEVAAKRKDGTSFDVQVAGSMVTDEAGKPICGMGSFVDITERKQAEAALRENELKFRSLFDLSPQPVVLTELNTGILLDANKRFCEVTQYTRENMLGNTVTDLGLWSEEERGKFVDELIQTGEINGINVRFKAKDGTILDVLLFAKTIQLGGKGLIFSTFVDFAKQRRLEARLHYAQRMEALGTLAGGIAHTFNNLLMGIQGNASLMLLDTPPGNPNYERLLNIEQQVESGSKLSKQLLGYAREGRHEIQPIDLNRLVKETSGTFGATRKEIRVHQELAKDLYIVTGDQGQIEQALLNLYINAADAMPGGGDLFIKTANVTDTVTEDQHLDHKPGEYVLLSVSDTGIGMDKKTMERIFDPFFTTKDMSKGTGLGLASVYGIIKNHDGTINVYSEKGEGTTFLISLPASRHQAVKEDIESTRVAPGKGNILLVDDEEMILGVASQMLEKMGYHVLKAKSGEEAIELYKENKDTIDLVILGMIMPGLGGGKTCDTIKEINPSIKILLSSGYSLENQATEIRGHEWDGFIQKPFKMNQLSRKIREILDSD